MNIKIDGEQINAIEICDFINELLEKAIKTSAYNFSIEHNWIEFYVTVWIEFYVTVKKTLLPKEICGILCYLNLANCFLQEKGWRYYFKSKQVKWFN